MAAIRVHDRVRAYRLDDDSPAVALRHEEQHARRQARRSCQAIAKVASFGPAGYNADMQAGDVEHRTVAARFVLLGAAVALVFALYVTVAAIEARHGGSDESPYSLALAVLIACLPALGATCAALAARRAWRTARGARTPVGASLLVASITCSLLGVVSVFAAWGYFG